MKAISNINPKLQNYAKWLQRVRRIRQAYQAGEIQADDLIHYQRFILQYGQFNANFTLDELDYLQYPKSPFALMHRNCYLRGTETWATEVLRQLFFERYPSEVRTFPVF